MPALPFANDDPLRAALARAQKAPLQPGSLESIIREHLRCYFAAHGHALPPRGLHARVLALIERPLIEETLNATGGNQLKAASLLGINRNTLRKKIRELGIALNEREER